MSAMFFIGNSTGDEKNGDSHKIIFHQRIDCTLYYRENRLLSIRHYFSKQ